MKKTLLVFTHVALLATIFLWTAKWVNPVSAETILRGTGTRITGSSGSESESESGEELTLDFGKEASEEQELPGTAGYDAESPGSAFPQLLSNVSGFVMVFAALALLIYLLWAGIQWITAGGDSSKVEKARNRITQAVIGILVLSASVAIFMVVQNFLDICVLNFGGACSSGDETVITTSGGVTSGTGPVR